jgi:hypothetical protein
MFFTFTQLVVFLAHSKWIMQSGAYGGGEWHWAGESLQ